MGEVEDLRAPAETEHTIKWGVLSEDGQVYSVTPNTREKAERECLMLQAPDEDGYAEPNAMVVEDRCCSWAGRRLMSVTPPAEQRAEGGA